MSMIKKWPQFENQVRRRDMKLLKRLDDFPDAILVAGCQRSGTTMLAKIIAESEGLYDFKLGATDACLDAALILAGSVDHQRVDRRYCFQTTHVDECYPEYLEHTGDFRMLWCLRNPLSVVYSLVYNWSNWGLNTTFMRCGVSELETYDLRAPLMRLLGARGVSKLHKACMIYNAKVSQIFELSKRLKCKGLVVVEYDELVNRKHEVLPKLYDFLEVDYRSEYADKILATSLSKANRLSDYESETILRLCEPVYDKARAEYWDTASDRPIWATEKL